MMKRVKRDGGGHPESIVLFFNGFDDRSFLLRHNRSHESRKWYRPTCWLGRSTCKLHQQGSRAHDYFHWKANQHEHHQLLGSNQQRQGETFETTVKKVQLKATDNHLITVKSDRDLFERLMIVANAKEVNIREVLPYKLSPVPCSLAHNDGSLRKATKSDLASALEDGINSPARLPVLASSVVYIVDGMALIQMHNSSGAHTFGELASRYFAIVIAYLSSELLYT